MKYLLLKFAHFILRKYGVTPLDMKDKVLYKGTIFKIKRIVLSRDCFKTELQIDMCDCLNFLDDISKI